MKYWYIDGGLVAGMKYWYIDVSWWYEVLVYTLLFNSLGSLRNVLVFERKAIFSPLK
jgi:hypothetical protein